MKPIHCRPTRPAERFNATDLYIAWEEGMAAGVMAETENKAIAKLRGICMPEDAEKEIDQLRADNVFLRSTLFAPLGRMLGFDEGPPAKPKKPRRPPVWFSCCRFSAVGVRQAFRASDGSIFKTAKCPKCGRLQRL